MKRVALVVAVVLGFASVQPVQAEEVKTIAIIDTAVDSSRIPNVVYEVCFTFNKTCQNQRDFQEGKNSAMINDWTIKGADHGHNMAQVAIQTDPNVKIVFIRIADEKAYDTFSIIRNDNSSLQRAIKWVENNASRLNIKAVSVSQSRSNFTAGKCPVDLPLQTSVAALKNSNVPVFVATGNDSKKNMIGFPSCVPGVVAVGALRPTSGVKPFPASAYNAFASYTNVGPGLALVAKGDADIKAYRGMDITVTGTSIATPIAAVLSMNNSNGKTITDFVATLPKSVGYPYISK